MCKKIPNVMLIVVLVAVIGCIDVLFGCCAIPDADLNESPSTYTNVSKVYREVIVDNNDNTNSGPFGRIRGYLPRTKIDIFNTFLIGFVLIFGFSLFVSLVSSSAKKGNIVQRAEKLGESLQHQSAYIQEKVDIVHNLLCKRLQDSSEDPPLKYSNTTHVSSTLIDPTEVTTVVPLLTTEDPREILCTSTAISLYTKMFYYVPNSYESSYPGYKVYGPTYDQIKRSFKSVKSNRCGSGFFQKKRMTGYDAVYFNANNPFVKFAVNDYLCEKTATETFALLDQLGQDVFVDSYNHIFEDTAHVFTYIQKAKKLCQNNTCLNGFFTFVAEDDKWGVSYNKSNPYIARGMEEYKIKKNCKDLADEFAMVAHAEKRIYRHSASLPPSEDGRRLSVRFNGIAAKVRVVSCERSYFTIMGNPGSWRFGWGKENVYVRNSMNYERTNQNCLIAAKNVVTHLQYIGVAIPKDAASVVVPNIGEDVSLLMSKINIAAGLTCEENFYAVKKADNGDFLLEYNDNNHFVGVTRYQMGKNYNCRVTATGLLRRFMDLGKHTAENENNVRIEGQPKLIAELKEKLGAINSRGCGKGYFRYTEDSNSITFNYHKNNIYIEDKESDIRKQFLCPKAAYLYSYILDSRDYSMNDNSTENAIRLSTEEKELVTTMANQISDIDCGNGFFAPVVNENEAIFSWHCTNTALQKIWTQVRSSFEVLY